MDNGTGKCGSIEEVIATAFPSDEGFGNLLCGIVRSIMEGSGVDQDALRTVVDRLGRWKGWMRLGPQPADALGFEYVDLVTPAVGFSRYNCPDRHRPLMAMALMTDRSGTPVAVSRADGDLRSPSDVYGTFHGTGCTVVTDRVPYGDPVVRALEKATREDHVIVQGRFPGSYGPTCQQKLQELRWEGRTYRTCKCRYDKRWLFRFVDAVEGSMVTPAIMSNPEIHKYDREHCTRTAGVTDAISPTGFDIREVRRMLDIRGDTDSWMRRCWDGACSDPLCTGPDGAFGLVTLGIIVRTVSMLTARYPVEDTTACECMHGSG